MIRFVDLETNNVFNGNKPYVFWMDDEQSVNLMYVKRICILSDEPVLNLDMPNNGVFQFVNMQNLNDFANVSVNEFDYKDIHNLVTLNYDSVGTEYFTDDRMYYLHMVYILAQSTAIGEFHEDFHVGAEVFEVAADFYADDENLRINLANFGIELPESIQNAIYDVNVHEEASDDITLNRKYKELLLNYWDIVANRGSYKSLINSLSWFEYGDIVKLQEIWKHKEMGRDAYSRADISQALTTAIRATLSKFAKTTYLGLYAVMEKFAKENGKVVNEHRLTNGFWGEEVPELEALAMRWTREEMSLKMYLLGCFYEAYFMPIHLDLLQSTIEDIVFTNTIKIMPAHNLGRFDFLSNFDSFDCNIKDGDVFQLGDVSVQAGDMLKKHYIDESDPEAYKTPMANVVEMVPQYLIFTGRTNGSTVGLEKLSSHQTLEYSYDKEEWFPFLKDTVITLAKRQRVFVRGMLEEALSPDDEYTQFKMTGEIDASGNCSSIWNYEDMEAQLLPYCGYSLFYQCTSLYSCPNLPSTELADNCYRSMFFGCTNIVAGPDVLPATKLADNCYRSMFSGCSNLESIPVLQADELAPCCYYLMFNNCVKLTEIPEGLLPVTELADQCYAGMFYSCSGLTSLPSNLLPAQKLTDHCYWDMFGRCTKLTSIPEDLFAADEVGPFSCCRMFESCSNLQTAPKNLLPMTTVGESGYYFMFLNCVKLTEIPDLPAMELSSSCYHGMFGNCTSLETAQEILPATKLPYTRWSACGKNDSGVSNAYSYAPGASGSTPEQNERYNQYPPYDEGVYSVMFSGCSNLKNAPILPAKTLGPGCYNGMFEKCRKLTRVIILADTLRVEIQDEWMEHLMDLVAPFGGTADRNFMEGNATTCWLGYGTNQSVIKWAHPQSAHQDWIFIKDASYYTHIPTSTLEIMDQSEIDEIIERYHIVYDE